MLRLRITIQKTTICQRCRPGFASLQGALNRSASLHSQTHRSHKLVRTKVLTFAHSQRQTSQTPLASSFRFLKAVPPNLACGSKWLHHFCPVCHTVASSLAPLPCRTLGACFVLSGVSFPLSTAYTKYPAILNLAPWLLYLHVHFYICMLIFQC